MAKPRLMCGEHATPNASPTAAMRRHSLRPPTRDSSQRPCCSPRLGHHRRNPRPVYAFAGGIWEALLIGAIAGICPAMRAARLARQRLCEPYDEAEHACHGTALAGKQRNFRTAQAGDACCPQRTHRSEPKIRAALRSRKRRVSSRFGLPPSLGGGLFQRRRFGIRWVRLAGFERSWDPVRIQNVDQVDSRCRNSSSE